MADNVIGEASIEIRASTEKFQRDIAGLTKEVQKSATSISDKFKQIGKSISNAGKTLTTKVTAPIVALGATTMAAWKQVDEAEDTIITKTGATGEEFENLKQVFQNIAKTMPFDIQTVGEAVGEMNTQFKLTGPALEEATKQMLQFAQINNTDVTTATQNAKAAMSAYGLQTKDLASILDAVTKASQDTGLSVDQIFDSVIRGAPQIKALGLDFATAAQLVGNFEQQGLDSNKMFMGLSRAQVNFAKQGKTLSQGMKDLIKKIKGTKDQTKQLQYASAIFSGRSAPAMLDAINRGAFDFYALGDAAESAAGAVKKTFEETLDPADKFTTAMNNLKLAWAEIGGEIYEILSPYVDSFIQNIQKFLDWFQGLPPETKDTIIKIVGAFALLGPILIFIGSLVNAFGAIWGVFAAIGRSIILPIIKAIGSVLSWLWKGVLVPALQWIAGILGVSVGWAAVIVAAVVAVVYLIIKYWDQIKAFLIKTWDIIKNVAITVWSAIAGFFTVLWNGIVTVVQSVWNWIVGFLTGLWNGIKDTATSIWNSVAGFFTDLWNGISTTVKGVWDSITTWLSDTWNGIKDTASSIWNGISDFFTGLWDGISKTFTNAWNSIADALSRVWDGISQTAENVWNGIVNTIEGVINTIIGVINGMIDGINKITKIKMPDWVPLIGGKTIGFEIPKIPLLAEGGIIKRPGLSIVGEAGPELLSLPQGATVQPLGTAAPINITVTGNYFQNRDDIDRVADAIVQRLKRAGVFPR